MCINLLFFDYKNKKKGDKYQVKIMQFQDNKMKNEKFDPYKNHDKLTQKVGITQGIAYTSASQNDVLSNRFLDRVDQTVMKNNPMLRKAYIEDKNFDIDYHQPLIIRSAFDPYQ